MYYKVLSELSNSRMIFPILKDYFKCLYEKDQQLIRCVWSSITTDQLLILSIALDGIEPFACHVRFISIDFLCAYNDCVMVFNGIYAGNG